MKSSNIKFGTDGWRAIIAHEFTVENVCRVGVALCEWLKNESDPKVVVGFDTRFGGSLFADSLAFTLCQNNIKVFKDRRFVTTPMVSYGTLQLKASLGIVFTASHNPPAYNGLKIKGPHGGPAFDQTVTKILNFLPDTVEIPSLQDLQQLHKHPNFESIDLTSIYHTNVRRRFDLKALSKQQNRYVFDAMYGSVQEYIKVIFPEMKTIRADLNPTFNGTLPEPIEKNLAPLKQKMLEGGIELGLAVDGDADRIGLMDKNGEVIDAHHIMLILIWYLNKYKGQSGKIVTGFSSTQKIKKLCKRLNLDLEIVKIGFKHAASIMVEEDVLLAGEEAGGIATRGHIPERDGLWNILLVLEMLMESGQTIEAILSEIEDAVGAFGYSRTDLHVDRKTIDHLVNELAHKLPSTIGHRKIQKTETLDGFKFYFNDDEWLMIRASGTEPLLRVYAESHTKEEAKKIIQAGLRHFDLV